MKRSFLLTSRDLAGLFDVKNIRNGSSMHTLSRMHGINGLCDSLRTSVTSGIDSSSLKHRADVYGNNYIPSIASRPFIYFLCRNISKAVVLFLMLALLIGIFIGNSFILSLLSVLLLILSILVPSVIDFAKEKDFMKQSMRKNKIRTIRDEIEYEIAEQELVVGDIILLKEGDTVPANCLIVRGSNIHVDEGLATGKSSHSCKEALTGADSDPFLISGSMMIGGACHAIVCSVGFKSPSYVSKRSLLGRKQDQITLICGTIGFCASLAVAIILLYKNDREDYKYIACLSTSLFLIAIPIGLPLMELLFTLTKTSNKNFILKNLKAIEIMGSVSTVCIDKTGTLTQNKMRVTRSELFGLEVSLPLVPEHLKELVGEIISRNSTAFVSKGKEEVGNQIECALLANLLDSRCNYQIYRGKPYYQMPFSSQSKLMTTVYKENSHFKVYCKGSADSVLNVCEFCYEINGQLSPLNHEKKAKLKNKVRDYSYEGLTVIGISYKVEDGFNEEDLEKRHILVGIFGIEDSLRNESYQSLMKCQEYKLNLFLITGDILETAISVSKSCGIYSEDRTGAVDSQDFKEKLQEVKPRDELIKEMSNIKVIGSSSPKDKLEIVTQLQRLKEVVAFVGDGLNDIPAIHQSDIGLAVKNKNLLTQKHSDILLEDLTGIDYCLKLGRILVANNKKYLQFLVTANSVFLVTVFMIVLSFDHVLVNIKQVLWFFFLTNVVGLMLYTFEKEESPVPLTSEKPLICKEIAINMISQIAYQILLMVNLLLYGHKLISLESEKNQNFHNDMKHSLFLYNSIVVLQVFNAINCRRTSSQNFNPVSGLTKNLKFPGFLVLFTTMHLTLMNYPSEIYELSGDEQAICFIFGTSVLLVGYISSMIVYLVHNKSQNIPEERSLLDD